MVAKRLLLKLELERISAISLTGRDGSVGLIEVQKGRSRLDVSVKILTGPISGLNQKEKSEQPKQTDLMRRDAALNSGKSESRKNQASRGQWQARNIWQLCSALL